MNQKGLSPQIWPFLFIVIAFIGWLATAFISRSEANGSMSDTGATIVVVGASYVESWDLNRPIAGYRMINKGVHGQQSFEMLDRFQHDVIALKPEAVIIWGFNNDVHRSDPALIDRTLRRTRESLLAMVQLAKQAGIIPILATEILVRGRDDWSEFFKALIGTIRAKESYQDYINRHVAEVNCWIRDTATREGIMLLDLEAVLTDQQGQRRKESAKPDGRHISHEGYEAVTHYLVNRLSISFAAR
ncbi:GDSL-type esterase/lipase family protein [Nitrospira sp. NS4]|uniref:GDSL-type esterase/lipase family protein n=1 Tax=Nitrospira sp. NS4 TaxID=3414498 RepID=UPI003C2FDFC6